jgi:hypothetical protein
LVSNIADYNSAPANNVSAIEYKRENKKEKVPCDPIIIFPFGSDCSDHNAGNIFTNCLISQFIQSGFRVVDPGQVQELMSEEGISLRGQVTSELLDAFRTRLNTFAVITGSVTDFGIVSYGREGTTNVVVQTRLLNSESPKVLWSHELQAQSSSNAIFGVLSGQSPSTLSQEIAARVVRSFHKVNAGAQSNQVAEN